MTEIFGRISRLYNGTTIDVEKLRIVREGIIEMEVSYGSDRRVDAYFRDSKTALESGNHEDAYHLLNLIDAICQVRRATA